MNSISSLSPKQAAYTSLLGIGVVRNTGMAVMDYTHHCAASVTRALGSTKLAYAIITPLAVKSAIDAGVTLSKGGPIEERVLAATGLGSALASVVDSVSATAYGAQIALEAAKKPATWVATLGTVGAILGIFGMISSGLGLFYTNRVSNSLDAALKGGPAEMHAFLEKLSKEKSSYLSRHFNLNTGKNEELTRLIKEALEGSDEKKEELLTTLKGRVTKKMTGNKWDLALGAISFVAFFTLSLCPILWVGYAFGVVMSLAYMGVLVYSIKASADTLEGVKRSELVKK